ncbi:hypothetical protein EV175_003788 [Coemansia sp. RSA 1933]|nr:hypothetical protein EV175_003788 [Coemansia sp. RSA 1933]
MKFTVALSFVAAATLANSVFGSPIKRDQANTDSFKGAAACIPTQPNQQHQSLTTAVANAGTAADLVIDTMIVTVTGGSGDDSDATSAAVGDTAEPTSEGAVTAASGDDSGDDSVNDSGAVSQDTGSVTSNVANYAAASQSLSAGSGAQDTVSSSAPTTASTEQQQDNTQASSSDSGSSSDSSQTFSGDGTYYTPGLGACGVTNTESDLIAAINAEQYGSSTGSGGSNSASICGKCVQVKGPNGQVKVKITDKCPSCKSGDLDLSPAAFDQIGSEAAGRISITWSFVDC